MVCNIVVLVGVFLGRVFVSSNGISIQNSTHNETLKLNLSSSKIYTPTTESQLPVTEETATERTESLIRLSDTIKEASNSKESTILLQNTNQTNGTTNKKEPKYVNTESSNTEIITNITKPMQNNDVERLNLHENKDFVHQTAKSRRRNRYRRKKVRISRKKFGNSGIHLNTLDKGHNKRSLKKKKMTFKIPRFTAHKDFLDLFNFGKDYHNRKEFNYSPRNSYRHYDLFSIYDYLIPTYTLADYRHKMLFKFDF